MQKNSTNNVENAMLTCGVFFCFDLKKIEFTTEEQITKKIFHYEKVLTYISRYESFWWLFPTYNRHRLLKNKPSSCRRLCAVFRSTPDKRICRHRAESRHWHLSPPERTIATSLADWTPTVRLDDPTRGQPRPACAPERNRWRFRWIRHFRCLHRFRCIRTGKKMLKYKRLSILYKMW